MKRLSSQTALGIFDFVQGVKGNSALESMFAVLQPKRAGHRADAFRKHLQRYKTVTGPNLELIEKIFHEAVQENL